jgi:hypothetical protein
MVLFLGFLMGAALYALGNATGLSLALWYINRNRRGYHRYHHRDPREYNPYHDYGESYGVRPTASISLSLPRAAAGAAVRS